VVANALAHADITCRCGGVSGIVDMIYTQLIR